MSETVKCNHCQYEGEADTFGPSMSYHHDLTCPKCGTTNLDTSVLNADWKAKGEVYGYGDDNFIISF